MFEDLWEIHIYYCLFHLFWLCPHCLCTCHVCVTKRTSDALGLVLIRILTWDLFNMDDDDLHFVYTLCGMSGSLFGKTDLWDRYERTSIYYLFLTCVGVFFHPQNLSHLTFLLLPLDVFY
jgi:hypothetical protein